MRQKVSDYIADILLSRGVTDVFSVVGGGSMHLNDSLGHATGLRVTYQHHEQACSMAADAYARVTGKPAAVCVTTGPGATNAITGVMGAYVGSVPMLVLSGQVRWATSVYASGLPLRTLGVQEFDIIGSVRNMTKYCETVHEPARIRYCLEKALYLACAGRPGPCWLDLPLDVQAAIIETDTLVGYQSEDDALPHVSLETARVVIDRLLSAERPLILAGNGIRLSGAHENFLHLVHTLQVPVVTTASSVDAIASDDPCFVGRTGMTGDRAGNFAVQNCDCLLCLGSRLSFSHIGFNTKTWARAAWRCLVDIDPVQLEKNRSYVDDCIRADADEFITALNNCAVLLPCDTWRAQCANWRSNYPVVLPCHYSGEPANLYAFFHEMTVCLSSADTIVVSCGSARVVGSQAAQIHEGMRFITNVSAASMGFDLPAATGVCVANSGKSTILVTGDGSIQMNLQELQTIVHHGYPVVIFVINNGGYHSIRQTQNAYFRLPLVGVGPESGDLSFPALEKISQAYGLPYCAVHNCEELNTRLNEILSQPRPLICEVFVGAKQPVEPKVTSRQTPDGQMVSLPLEDMAPFLTREELEHNMLIPLMENLEWSE
ncbi:MAG: thiamine pyrophosphate-binding protein [Eubacteriales bacterium]|jgi:acetolactate synthase-1/2/3 large subunit|nr:thiamine pyrophosphate-binding protein [Eubacteriales bacterium]